MTTSAPPSPPSPRPAHTTAGVIVAAGQGLRAGQALPKQFALWRGQPVVRHSVAAMAAAGIAPIIVAIPPGAEQIAAAALLDVPGVRLVTGGATRQDSVRLALEALVADGPDRVLIHDAARPVLPLAVLERLSRALDQGAAAIPVLAVVDSLAQAYGTVMGAPAPREQLRRVQTPQAFHFAAILADRKSVV